uniref:Reverse transcriptase domain-containing protein n=1 Tax=Caenorhabditis japonica TaxID=281687 RepID=A0A8R1ER61_CAEJA
MESLIKSFLVYVRPILEYGSVIFSPIGTMLHEIRSSLCILFFYSGNLGSRIAGVQKVDHGYDVPLQVYRR